MIYYLGQKILPIIKEDNRYKNLYKDFGYQKYNGFNHFHDHDHDSFHGHDKDYKFIKKIDYNSHKDRDDYKFYNRIDDDYAKRIVIPYNLRNDRPLGASYGSWSYIDNSFIHNFLNKIIILSEIYTLVDFYCTYLWHISDKFNKINYQ